VLLIDSLNDLHPDKLPDALQMYVRDGRGNEVRQAIPELSKKYPKLKPVFASILTSMEPGKKLPDMICAGHGVAISCANCGGTLTRQAAETRTVICQYCGCDAEHPPSDGLSKWAGRIDTQAKFSVGSFFTFRGEKWQAIGVQGYKGTVREYDTEDDKWINTPARFSLWWMLNEKRELAWLSDYGKKRYWSRKHLPKNPSLPEPGKRSFEYGRWKLQFAAGEFSHRVLPGEVRKTWESTKAPKGEEKKSAGNDKFIYSTEAQVDESDSPVEIEFFRSIAISNKELLRGIGSKKLLSAISRWRVTAALLFGTAVASPILGYALQSRERVDEVLSYSSTFTQESPQTLGELRIEEAPTLLRFTSRLLTGLPANRYKEFDVDLENTNQEVIGGYSVEFWRETGFDDEGRWDESRYQYKGALKITESGIYSVVGQLGATNVPTPAKISVTVTTNPVEQQPFFFSLFGGAALGMLSLFRSRSIGSSGASLGGKIAPNTGKGRRRKKRKPNNRKASNKPGK